MLASVSLFRPVPSEALARLAEQGRRRHFSPGSQLMRQGDVSQSMHIILEGRVRVERMPPHVPQPIVLAELGPNEVVGEIGLLDEGPRTATVTALRDTQTLELEAAALAQMILEYPEVGIALLQVLSQRLRSTDELIEQMRRSSSRRSMRTALSGPDVGPRLTPHFRRRRPNSGDSG